MNRSAARFCDTCGTLLAPVDDRPAPELGSGSVVASMQHERRLLVGERRTVTVMFIDAVDFTPTSERLGEEAVYLLMQDRVSQMLATIHRHEGTITQFRGDGVMALFGAPIASEGAARRAVVAALELQHALEAAGELRFRIGLHTGPVVVGDITSGLTMDYTAVGDTVNLAARLEAAAEPGTVLLSNATHAAVAGSIVCERLDPVALKGKSELIDRWRAVRSVHADAPARRASSPRSPFVGRAAPLATLERHVDRAVAGTGGAVLVSGPPGIGKSRILQELRARVVPRARWWEGRCTSYGTRSAYLAIVDLLGDGLAQEDDHRTRADPEARLGSLTSRWEPAATTVVPYLRFLLSIDPPDPDVQALDPKLRQAEILDGLRTLVLQESQLSPLVLVVQDVHWADERTLDAVGSLAEAVQDRAALLLVTSRQPDVRGIPSFDRVHLGALGARDAHVVADSILGPGPAAPVRDAILGRAEGNPFFIEELARSMVESLPPAAPAPVGSMPRTIEEVILVRIDRLLPQARTVLRLASVIGREFSGRILDRVTGAPQLVWLEQLVQHGLIARAGRGEDDAYRFSHTLTHEVAYSTLLETDTRELHRAVGDAIEVLAGAGVADRAEDLAFHFCAAQAWDRAVPYLGTCADRSVASHDTDAAIALLEQLLEAGRHLGDDLLVARTAGRSGFLRMSTGDFRRARRDLQVMHDLAQHLGQTELVAMSLVQLGLTYHREHRFVEAEDALRRAIDLAGDHDGVRFQANAWLAELMMVLGRHDDAGPRADAERLAASSDDGSVRMLWGGLSAFWLIWEGRFVEAADRLDSIRSLTTSNGTAFYIAMHHWLEALSAGGAGDYDRALGCLEAALVVARRGTLANVEPRIQNTYGWIHAQLEDHQGARRWNERAVASSVKVPSLDPEVECNSRLNLGDDLAALGLLDEAQEQYVRVEGLATDPRPEAQMMRWRYSQHLAHSYGELWLARGDIDQALAWGDLCLDGATRSNSRKYVVAARRLRGAAWLAAGEPRSADDDLSAALTAARDLANPPQTWKTLSVVADLRLATGDEAGAGAALEEACGLIELTATRLRSANLRRSLVASAFAEGLRKRRTSALG